MNLADAAIIAIGANLGNPTDIVLSAIQQLRTLSDEPVTASSLYRTVPVDCPPGSPSFINAVVALKPRPNETSESLLAKLQRIEREFGRRRTGTRNEARRLDLDLIAFGREVRSDADLTLPHPRAHARIFVLAPLNEIAAEYLLPLQAAPVNVLLKGLSKEAGGVERLKA